MKTKTQTQTHGLFGVLQSALRDVQVEMQCRYCKFSAQHQDNLDSHTRGLLKMYRAKANQGKGREMEALLENLDCQTTNLTAHRRCTVLRGLPLYMREEPSISKTLLDTEALEDHTKNVKIGIFEVVKGSAEPSRSHTSVVNVAVVLEEEVVMANLPDYTNAFILLFGLLYALNIEYTKDLKYTFEVVQKVFLHLGNECTARVQSLKNKLSHI
ncbi:sterile alpha motif domain-containing protein 3-like [Astyanax mexicanus]|uniref:Sterile alpha motif domain-containing protein 3-like n=1 Tax=Astyanax mexicanus TaxID=7994 RepID=A0A8T2M6E0_ASTMX|nr:sterile alpha motif domain-containing protein 3-like [Astyanax mexicanus]KAG9281209.1 sterile alpha motif domain-containing protein 3-like [Astyanax mexicanus]